MGLLCGVLAICGFVFARQALLVESVPRAADAIVVLGGGLEDRSRLAASLFASGVAPRVIVTGWGDCLQCKKRLIDRGVPEAVIDVDCDALNTNENAQNAIRMLRAQGSRRVILVTTWYHSRRALSAFQFYGPDLAFSMVPTYHHLKRRALPTLSGASYVFREYVKIGWYLLRHGIAPTVSEAVSDPYPVT